MLLAPTLIGAIAFVHGSHGWIYTSPGGGWEYLAVLLFISAAVVLLGNGALSLQDRLAGASRRARETGWSASASVAQ
ncbi:hypothetical protein [Bordetella sp. H567]|uniref:hypothetical protein n=1 Tax=Bordetella sp. H567 TaxID=1697043 RepID=UPI00191376BC|nr:hypothetical protein [Bordetella sp. H567]